MNWEIAGTIGELLGAVAVVVSLVYLSRQVRDETRQSRASNYHDMITNITAFLREVGSDGDTASLYTRGLAGGLETLDEVERVRFILLLLSLLKAFEEIHLSRANGGLPDWVDEVFEDPLRDLMALPGPRDFWALRQHQFSDAFRAQVDAMEFESARPVHGQSLSEAG